MRALMAFPRMVQQRVADFIALWHPRYARGSSEDMAALPALKDEAFIGMWRDCEDMADRHAWVRAVRTREWGEEG